MVSLISRARRFANRLLQRTAARTKGELKSRIQPQFSQSELKAFLGEVRASGISFLPVDGFAERLKTFYATRPIRPPAEPFGMIKLDIHRDIVRPLEVARVLSSLEIPGLFLMMPRHPFNADWYDLPSTWDTLKAIRDLGHEVGLHPDLFHLIGEHGDLYKGLSVALEDMRGRGVPVRAATVHGDTRKHIKAVRLQANDFFEEEFRGSKWTGDAPEGEEYLADHVRKYSHRRIADELGVKFFAETRFVDDGRLVTEKHLLYLSDNARFLEIRNISGREEDFRCEQQFKITPEFTQGAIPLLKKRPFLALFHPQWFAA